MTAELIGQVLGGVGLFLLGMVLMTEGLKTLAGDSLKALLGRYVGGPLSAFGWGTVTTALVQSSTVTTLTTISVVSAGLLSFPQAVGLIIGANVGTTSTGWLVSLLGLKFSVSRVALPLVGLGAMAKVLGGNRLSAAGTALAGFGLVFVGIDTLQAGMGHLSTRFDPSSFPRPTVAGSLLLAGMGLAMTVVMQSSSAAVAVTLAALHTGTIGLEQAAALVVGQNLGTTVTAGLAAVGAPLAARRAAAAHVLFNGITGLCAFAILHPFVLLARWLAGYVPGDPQAMALAAFHTLFNLLGAALFLPVAGRFARLVTRLVPEEPPLETGAQAAAGVAPFEGQIDETTHQVPLG